MHFTIKNGLSLSLRAGRCSILMKSIVQILCTVVVLQSCISGNSREFAEFYVEDVSKEQEFIDSTSALAGKMIFTSHQVMDLWIEGELDSGAVIQFYSYPDYELIRDYDLVKGKYSVISEYGKIAIKRKLDYYEGDTLLIRYIPKGATKGHLKISTNIL